MKITLSLINMPRCRRSVRVGGAAVCNNMSIKYKISINVSKVKVEKYLTPEQQAKLEAERKAEEERRAREKQDNWRDRGLDKMMGGLLEVKKEDELKKDVPKPAFMTVSKQFILLEKKLVA